MNYSHITHFSLLGALLIFNVQTLHAQTESQNGIKVSGISVTLLV